MRPLAVFTIFSCLPAFLFTAPALAGEIITYPGKTPANGPWGTPGSIFSSTSWNDNTLNITGGATITGHAYGGARAAAGSVTGNTVDMSAGRVNNNVYGGRSDTLAGDTLNNTVKLSGTALVDKVVYGGYNAKGNANFNIVDLSGGAKVTGDVNGGWSNSGGTANNNSVTLSDNAIAGAVVYGGRNAQGDASNNSVTLSDNASVTDAIFGGWSDILGGNVTYNTADINGGTAKDNVYGGRNVKGLVSYNTVTMTAGSVLRNVHGGVSENADGTATYNIVNIFGGTVGNGLVDATRGSVYGGKNLQGDANYNRVNISVATSRIERDVYGGWSNIGVGTASFNSVIMSAGTVNFNVYGGKNMDGDANDNTVSISGGTVGIAAGDGNVYGGYSDNAVGTAKRNAVILIGGTINKNVYGGYNLLGDASDNIVNISGGLVGVGGNGNIYGGYSDNAVGIANRNTVTLTGGTINQSVYGGYNLLGDASYNSVALSDSSIWVKQNVYGGFSDNAAGSTSFNSVIMSAGKVDQSIYGGYNLKGDASDNIVSISGGTVGSSLYGGFSDTGAGTANRNNVLLTGGTVTNHVYGGYNAQGDASYNSVTLSDPSIWVKQNVYGGFSDNAAGSTSFNSVIMSAGKVDQSIYGGYNLQGDASDNNVTLSGGTVAADVHGGWSAGGNARNNSLTLSGTPVLTTAALYGNNNPGGGTSWQTDGNTLNVYNTGHVVSHVANFQNYNFFLPPSYAAGSTMLTVTGITNTDISGSTVKINFTGGGSPLAAGDRLTFLKTTGAHLVGTPASYTASVTQGVSLQYSLTFLKDINSLYATVNGVTIHPQTKALSEGTVAELAFLNQGADLASDQGITAAVSAWELMGKTGRAAVFGTLSGGTSRYRSGSHVDVDGFSLISGVAWGTDLSIGKLVLGPFFETGHGNYNSFNSFNSFNTASSVTGNGSTKYYGVGILGHYQLQGLYVDASVRAGQAKTGFKSADLHDDSGRQANYDTTSAYYGAHVALGYAWEMNEKAKLDFFSKYLWTHREGDSVTVLDDPVKFQNSNSHRWRNGIRFSYIKTEQITPYIGAAYEYEFDGKAKATTYGYSITPPSLEGGTSIGELGVSFKPSNNKSFSADLGLQGYTGVRKGITGSFQAKYKF